MAFCRDVCKAMASYYLEAGCPIIAMVDPMTSQIGPDQMREFISPFATPVFESIRERGGLSSFFVCGHAQQNVEAMCDCRPDNISVDENIPLQYVRDVCLPRGISFGGNLQLTSVLLLGKPIDAQRNAIACLEIGGERGFVLAPGCDLPYATPPENLEAVTLVVRDVYQRQVAKATVAEQAVGDFLDMSQYGQADKVIVDIITLDSEACAPCQMKIARRKASLYVLGDGGPKCIELVQRCERAIAELGTDAKVSRRTDPETIASYGVAPVQTPAVVLARYVLKSTRQLPEISIIKEWLKDVR